MKTPTKKKARTRARMGRRLPANVAGKNIGAAEPEIQQNDRTEQATGEHPRSRTGIAVQSEGPLPPGKGGRENQSGPVQEMGLSSMAERRTGNGAIPEG